MNIKARGLRSRTANYRSLDRLSTHGRVVRFTVNAIMYHLLAFAVIPVLANRPGQASDPEEAAKPIAEVNLLPNNYGLALLPARCFGEVQYFLLDTGFTATVIDDGLRSSLGRPVRMGIFHAGRVSFHVDVFKDPAIFLDGLRLKERTVVCFDLGPLNNLLRGEELIGIIGMDRLSEHVVALDMTEGVVRFYESVPESVKRDSACLELQRRKHQFFVTAELPAIGQEHFLLDTGYNSSLKLRSGIFDRLARLGEIEDRFENRRLAVGGMHTTVQGRLSSLELGSFKHTGLTVGRAIDDEAVSVIGSAYLLRYVVVFDFPGERLYLKPSKYFKYTEGPSDKSGLAPVRRDGHTFISYLDQNSPAREAGLRNKDQILRVNDKPVDQFSLYKLRKLLTHEGKLVRMTIQRGERTFDVKFRLREYRTFLPDPPVEAPIEK